MRRPLYRVRQFLRALGARPSPADRAVVAGYLSPWEQRLFERTSARDQFHHVETLRLLSRDGPPSHALARAALLHDVGKGYIRLYERVLYVLLHASAPALLDRLAPRNGPGPLGALYRTRHHAAVGAELLRRLGADPRLVELVARHHDPPGDDVELAALIAADDEA